jgi:ABC-type lipoprotein export system ATPase subunit
MLLEINKINKSFYENEKKIQILNDLSFSIDKKEIVSICGSSGSGKSTLMNIISGLLTFDSGEIIFDGNIFNKNFDFSKYRNSLLGIVFQDHYLISELTVIENIMLPQIISGINSKDAKINASSLLGDFNLLNIKDSYPKKISGGEKQRIAILRAIINKPKLILADEPTGSIDEFNKDKILYLFKDIVLNYDTAILMVTHDNKVSQISNKILKLVKGKII